MDVPVERCAWAMSSDLMAEYHDNEWGVPEHDDRKLFEYLVLDAFQAGLSWAIVLRKREAFRAAFRGFEPEAVAGMSEGDVDALLTLPTIIRNRSKIVATISNAEAFLRVAAEFGTFDSYLWEFVEGSPRQNRWLRDGSIPAETEDSRRISVDLKHRGFRFVGPTIVYAVMQSAGLVNDHIVNCFRHAQLMTVTR